MVVDSTDVRFNRLSIQLSLYCDEESFRRRDAVNCKSRALFEQCLGLPNLGGTGAGRQFPVSQRLGKHTVY